MKLAYRTKKEEAKRKRKRLRTAGAGAVLRLCVSVLIALAVAATGTYAWRGPGASGDEPDPRIGLKAPSFDAECLSSGVRGSIKAMRIDTFLEGRRSPLAGLGSVFADAERETGVSAELLAAITLAESSCATDGALSVTNHNAWGMKGPQPALGITAQGGYCWWPDWPSAIHGAARFISHYWGPAEVAGQLKGYACGSTSWARAVEGARQAIL